MLKSRLVKLILPMFAAFALSVGIPTTASAHHTKFSAHNKKQCNRYKRKAKRRACRRCIARGHHHFHPYKKGGRCMKNGHYKKRHPKPRHG